MLAELPPAGVEHPQLVVEVESGIPTLQILRGPLQPNFRVASAEEGPTELHNPLASRETLPPHPL